MFGRTETHHADQGNIRLVVEDEQALYSTFSAEAEFNEAVKGYIREKVANRGYHRFPGLTVVSRKPMDETRFLSAVSNWVGDEKAAFSRQRKNTVRVLIGMLIFGSVLVIFNICLQQKYEVAKYSLVPIMGSVALSRAVGILIMDVPLIVARKRFLSELEKNNGITFEYSHHPE